METCPSVTGVDRMAFFLSERRAVCGGCGVSSVNPITGRWEEPRPSPMEGMTDEQKEYEAIQLVNKLDKLQR